jgi:hypothetical protein
VWLSMSCGKTVRMNKTSATDMVLLVLQAAIVVIVVLGNGEGSCNFVGQGAQVK